MLSQLVFRHSPGQAFEFHLLDHNLDYTLPYLFLPKLTLIAAVVVGLCLRDWGAKPRPAKALALLGLPLIALGTVAGYVDEIRQYSECYPGLVALAFPTVMASLGHDVLRKNHGAPAGDDVAPVTSG